ncbi:two-component system response regulator [Luteolibacter algae]|uniref:Two-component system response regulator n=1 Tax=Luteolibacter algae TaxID=454151 RepID=A0ABW5D7B2_9BACT
MNISTKILLIDDEVDFTELLAANLEESGYVVRQINDPTKALETARTFKPDICIIDLVMPRMDGGDVVSALKGDSALAAIPVLMLTALVEEDPTNPGELQMKGGLPFVSKTSDLEVIINAVKTQLGHR